MKHSWTDDNPLALAIGVASAVVPSLLLLWYFYARDVNPKPRAIVFKTFALGFLVVIPVAVLELTVFADLHFVTHPLFLGLTKGFWGAAIPEELLKFMVVVFYCARHREFNERMDGMVYGAVASLGFATLENLLYVRAGDLAMAISRGVTAVPCHAFLGAIMGYYVGQARFDSRGRGRLLATGLVLAILLHGLYDSPLLTIKALGLSGRPLTLSEVLLVSALSGLALGALTVAGGLALRLNRRLRTAQLSFKARLEAQLRAQARIREKLFQGHLG